MIRMGKSSKLGESNTTPETGEHLVNPAVSARNDSPSGNAFSESELMARDIKEGRLSGFVGGGTVLTGETTFESMLRIDGHLKGQVSSEDGTLIIGSTGQVDADVMVSSAIINGAVNGDVVASEKITLGRTARVVGNIHTPRLIIEDGAVLEGSCSMIRSQEALESRVADSQKGFSTSELVPTVDEEDDDDVEEPSITAYSADDDDAFENDEEEEEDDATLDDESAEAATS